MVLGAPATETVTITNNDFAGTFSFSLPSYSVAEAKTSVALTVKRTIPSGGTAAPTIIQYATADGTATSGGDYTGTAGNAPLTFLAGKTTATLTVPLTLDIVGEGDETFTVTLTSGGPDGGILGSPASVPVKILDDDVRVSFGAPTYAPKEPATGLTTLIIPVKRVGPTGTPFDADYAVGGTASPADFTLAPPAPLSFAASDTVKNITLVVNPDGLFEGPETVVLTLLPTGAGLGAIPITTATITDEEPVIGLGAATYKFTEPSSSGFATIYVKRTGNLNLGSQVSYTINAGTAQDGADYNAAGATPASPLTFLGGQSSIQIRVPLLADTEDEPVQSFTLTLSSPVSAALGALSTTAVNLNDNDVAGKITLVGTQWSVTEGVGSAILTLTRSGGSASGASVVCQTGTGSATGGTDYTATSQTVAFGAGQTSATCTIPITQDGDSEGSETVPVSLASPSFGVTLGTSSGTLFIVDDE
jgi:hypothetical protein